MESPGSLPWPGPGALPDATRRAALSQGGSGGGDGWRCVPAPRELPRVPERECTSLRSELGAAPSHGPHVMAPCQGCLCVLRAAGSDAQASSVDPPSAEHPCLPRAGSVTVTRSGCVQACLPPAGSRTRVVPEVVHVLTGHHVLYRDSSKLGEGPRRLPTHRPRVCPCLRVLGGVQGARARSCSWCGVNRHRCHLLPPHQSVSGRECSSHGQRAHGRLYVTMTGSGFVLVWSLLKLGFTCFLR